MTILWKIDILVNNWSVEIRTFKSFCIYLTHTRVIDYRTPHFGTIYRCPIFYRFTLNIWQFLTLNQVALLTENHLQKDRPT